MDELAGGFRDLESGLAARDVALIRDRAARLGPPVRRLALPRAQNSLAVGASARSYASRIGALLEEIDELAAQDNVGGAEQAFFELRNACVACHVEQRSDNSKRGLYPALGNTVTGQVGLRALNGDVIEDRSAVLVFLESGRAEPTQPQLRKNPAIDQRGRRFHPQVLPVVKGTTVDFPNEDTLYHNVFSLSKAAPFDLGIYKPGKSRSVTMERAGLIKVYCNIHPEMQASIVVLENPHFCVSSADGRFVISGVPDGRYTLRAWNDKGAETRHQIELADGEWLTSSITLRETRHVVPHKNKFGKQYPRKYQ